MTVYNILLRLVSMHVMACLSSSFDTIHSELMVKDKDLRENQDILIFFTFGQNMAGLCGGCGKGDTTEILLWLFVCAGL